MKRVATVVAALFVALNASALSVTNPLFMPESASFMSETELGILGLRSGDDTKTYVLTEKVSFNFTDAFQIGAYLGFEKIDFSEEGANDEDGFTNPGVFANYRLLNNGLIFDIGAEVQAGVFDKVTAKDDKFGLTARLGADAGVLSFGGDAKLFYVNPEEGDNKEDAEVGAFAILDIKDIFGIGAEARYYAFDAFDSVSESGEILARVDINPLEKNLGFVIFAGYTRYFDEKIDGYKAGARFKIAF